MKKIGLMLSLFCIFSVGAEEIPILLELNLHFVALGPKLSQDPLMLKKEASYLLVLVNDFSTPFTLHHDTFGQDVFTQYLQGPSSVSYEGFEIPAHSKVYWLLVPKQEGEYAFFISDPSKKRGPVTHCIVSLPDAPKGQPEGMTLPKKQSQTLLHRSASLLR